MRVGRGVWIPYSAAARNQQSNTLHEGGISDAWLVSDCAGDLCSGPCDT